MLQRFVCGAFCAVFLGVSSAKDTSAPIGFSEFERKVTDYIEAGLACHDNPGVSLSVVKDGGLVLAKGFGHKTLDRLESVTSDTLFGIASLSKAFAATLILKQIEENDSISLSTQIRSIFGRNEIFRDGLRSKYTTVEDLLAHRMGTPSNNNIRLDDTLTRKTLINRLKFLSPKGGFRTSYYYSNLMYGLITYMSEAIGGKSWEELVKQKIFGPLGMTSSTFVTTADPDYVDIATGYQDRYGTLVPVPFEFSRHWGLLCGSGCVLSNAKDMANWMLFHLNNGRDRRNESVIDPDILADAHKAQNSIPSSTSDKYYTRPVTPVTFSHSNYGLGWRLGHYRGFPILTHTGSTYGYRAMLTLIPGMHLGIYTAMTGDDPSYFFRTNIHIYIADLLLGYNPWLNNSTVCSFPEPWQHKSAKKPLERPRKDIAANKPLTKYEGLFSNDGYGVIEIYHNDSAGFLMAIFGIGQFVLYPKTTPDLFYAQGYGVMENVRDFSKLRFDFDQGEVTTLTVPSFEYKDPPVFKLVKRKESVEDGRAKRNNHSPRTHNLSMFLFLIPLLPIFA